MVVDRKPEMVTTSLEEVDRLVKFRGHFHTSIQLSINC